MTNGKFKAQMPIPRISKKEKLENLRRHENYKALMKLINEARFFIYPETPYRPYLIATDEQKKNFKEAVEKAGLVAEAMEFLPKMGLFSIEGMREAGISYKDLEEAEMPSFLRKRGL